MKLRKQPDLCVIIVSYNTADFLERCLNSVALQSGVDAMTVVVDNCSRDNSQDLVREKFGWVKLIANDRNLGFSRANNQALELCRGTYVYFLNPDTEVRPGAFKKMVGFMDARTDVGLAGTRLVHPDGSLQESVEFRYPGHRHAGDDLRGLKGDVAWVMGSSMIARLDTIQALGGFDERFFLYGEDLDLCLRVRKSGWIVGHIPEAIVVHWGGQSERGNLPAEVWKKKFDAELLFYRTHYSKKSIRSIKRAGRAQALWRILTLNLTLLLSTRRPAALAKLEKYRLALDMWKEG